MMASETLKERVSRMEEMLGSGAMMMALSLCGLHL